MYAKSISQNLLYLILYTLYTIFTVCSQFVDASHSQSVLCRLNRFSSGYGKRERENFIRHNMGQLFIGNVYSGRRCRRRRRRRESGVFSNLHLTCLPANSTM